MDCFSRSSGFCFNPNSNTISDGDQDSEFSGILEIYVHHARNIHNICIYDNQDVYAKFSLTYNPDDTHSTRIINGGGKNPEFNENLMMKVTQMDAVLKCEIWMLSRARNYMEDQLLGFALVPISQVVGKGKVTQDYSLSSTDLFHSPAGTVKLSLSLNTICIPANSHTNSFPETTTTCSISAEVVLLDRKISQVILDPVEYSRIEFPDINVVRENQKMVSEYFDGLNSRPGGIASFLHLGGASHHQHQHVEDYEMTANSSEENNNVGSISPNGSLQNSGFLSSTTTSLSDDSTDKKKRVVVGESSNSLNASVTTEANPNSSASGACPDTPTSKKGGEIRDDEKDSNYSNKESENSSTKLQGNINMASVKFGQVFEAEQSAMQQQIVDMYMRSMQQFTESLAKMKLPMDLDHKPQPEHHGHVIQNNHHTNKIDQHDKKKDGSRVFYGSRAFF
ncbi:C2 calcium-dependent membrane targeting [Corchorus capsularis]|uniref:C2 calcium-dependent membrane targeting n=1 Tax=Corchorus capsularis TaxID=210143 RepID=A0A1R3FZC3_COCAP|nr:C2 calcium-dependent membrane targeting [Corchorus capsularis]